ncbi:MAG: (2Fe-2S)-binding protein [Opitutaceae bacterium]|nr:(2Fe-2S)-binding protein [Opitutaceae bacterium]
MSDQPKDDGLITINLDGRDVRCRPGANIVDVAASAGVEIPHYCYHPKLTVSGNCRMCLVEMGMPGRDRATGKPMTNPDGSPLIQWMPGPAIACGTKAAPGMHIRTTSDVVKKCREGVQEFLLINHPLDCPICDQAGECRLQEFATGYGKGYSRFEEQKNVKPKRTQLGPRVTLDDERCILCSRCIRFSREIAKDDVLGFTERGSYSTLTCYPGKKLENNYSLNTVDICPVGALTSTDFRFKMRVWFLKQTPSIDTETSTGCNTEVWSREGKIYRITPRQNDAVNDTWMPDSGRELYKQVEAPTRLKSFLVRGQAASTADAIREATTLLKSGSVAIVGSGRASVEEQWVLKKIATALGGASVRLVSRVGQGDDLLVSADRNPNVRGALVTGLISKLPEQKLTDLAADIDAGRVKTLLVHGEDLTAAGLTEAQLAKVQIVALATQADAITAKAAVVLAGLTVFEKFGSFVNQQFRLQKFVRAVPGPDGAADDLVLLASLLANLTGVSTASTVDTVWTSIAAEVPLLKGLSFQAIEPTGVVLDGSSFAGLPFVEGKSLRYDPAAVTAVKAG